MARNKKPAAPVVPAPKKAGTRAAKNAAKGGAFAGLKANINKASETKYGFEPAGQFYSDVTDWISTGCIPLDVKLYGGYPKGRLIETHGPPSHGKSTLLNAAFKSNQDTGGINALLMTEHCIDTRTMNRWGIRTDDDSFIPIEVESLEQAHDWLMMTIKEREENPQLANRHLLVGYDSVSNAQMEEIRKTGDPFVSGMASKARDVRSQLRTLIPYASRVGVTLFFIRHIHDLIPRPGQAMYGPKTNTDCGKGIDYGASLELTVRRKERLWEESSTDADIGILTEVGIEKSKCGPPPFNSFVVPILSNTGIDNDSAMFEFLSDLPFCDYCQVCTGKVPGVSSTGIPIWLSDAWKTCPACNGTGWVIHPIDGAQVTVTSCGVSSNGARNQYRYICGYPAEPVITFTRGKLRPTLDARPGLRTFLAQMCARKSQAPFPIKIAKVE